MRFVRRGVIGGGFAGVVVLAVAFTMGGKRKRHHSSEFLGDADRNAQKMVDEGRQIFRFDTFGDEAFWGGQLQLHQAVATLSPKAVLDLGIKVDAEALPHSVVEAIEHGRINLNPNRRYREPGCRRL